MLQSVDHLFLSVLKQQTKLEIPQPAPKPAAAPAKPAAAVSTRSVTISSIPKGATVKSGKLEGKTPCTLELEAGDVDVEISREGYQTLVQKVAAGERLVNVKLVKLA